MEEKRRETGSPPPAATISGGSSIKSTDSPATEPPPRRRGQKRKSSASTSTVSSAPPKRHAREKAAAAAAAASGSIFSLPPIHHGPLTRARQLSDSNAAIFSALNAIKNEASVAANEAAVAEAKELSAAQEEEMKKFESIVDGEIERIRNRGENVHVVPVAAGWFSWTNIHSVEKQTLPSFFNGKLESWTPDIYKEIRNWIMKKFHANPSTNVETKDLSELSVGDLEARQEIMEFLEHWGLINYHPCHQKDPENVDTEPNADADADKAEKTDSVLEKLYQFENEQSSSQYVLRANTSTAAVPSGLFPESITEELVKQEGPAVEYHCNSCSADCSRKRYHCQKQADFDLCSECYNNGKFGSGMCPSDFILMEPAEASGSTGGKWTDQETLLLLEALELFRENWNEIAEHVATKTKAQCILHFLQMPIEDSFLDYDDVKDTVLENGEPISTKIEVPVVKDNSEVPEGDTGKDSSGPAEGESGKDGPEALASESSKVNAEPSEVKTDINADQPKSAQTETSNLEDVVDEKVVQGKGDDIVIKALKEAFNVAGCPLTPEDKLCFADAGNTVMALVAFLSQLVEPGLANASARNSLKAISQSSPGSQLAEKHCFILEDPPEDPKDHIASESTTTEKIDQKASEMDKEELKRDKEITYTENSTLPVAENPSTEGEVHENSDTKEKPQLAPAELGIDDSNSTEKPNEEIPQATEKSIAKTRLVKKPSKEKLLVIEKPDEENSQVPEKSDEVKSQVAEKSDEEKSQVAEKPDEEKSQLAEKPCVEKLKEAEKHDNTNNEQAGPKSVDDSLKNEQSSATKKHKIASGNEPENLKTAAESSVSTNGSKDTDMGPTSVSDKIEQQETSGAVPMVGVLSESGEDKMDVDKKDDTKNTKPTCKKDEDNVAKLKRAALATLSAAAVKAKLLANQEEDEIRQLATVLIEKQMRKLEIKLSYFNDMDNAISRVREQLERSRQKLFNERAQIIASRLGIPPSSRMLPSSYPINRMPPGFVNSMMRPPMNMGAQRPPIARPVVTSAPPTANTSAPPEGVGGNATQPPAAENPCVETN